jgi:hypothetical protein
MKHYLSFPSRSPAAPAQHWLLKSLGLLAVFMMAGAALGLAGCKDAGTSGSGAGNPPVSAPPAEPPPAPGGMAAPAPSGAASAPEGGASK